MIDYTDRRTDGRTQCKNIYIDMYFYILSVCLSVCVVDHALTAVLIDFIFGMNIDVIPGSDIGTLGISFFILKDHLWTKYFLCDVPYVQ